MFYDTWKVAKGAQPSGGGKRKRKTPCPKCGQLKRREAKMCIACRKKLKAEIKVEKSRCPQCGGRKAKNARRCRDCAPPHFKARKQQAGQRERKAA
jgi:predicted RNA-binding Zn-ribbon protein involved in translation (DUF1610 family)